MQLDWDEIRKIKTLAKDELLLQEKLYRHALFEARLQLGKKSLLSGIINSFLSECLEAQGRLEESELHAQESETILREFICANSELCRKLLGKRRPFAQYTEKDSKNHPSGRENNPSR